MSFGKKLVAARAARQERPFARRSSRSGRHRAHEAVDAASLVEAHAAETRDVKTHHILRAGCALRQPLMRPPADLLTTISLSALHSALLAKETGAVATQPVVITIGATSTSGSTGNHLSTGTSAVMLGAAALETALLATSSTRAAQHQSLSSRKYRADGGGTSRVPACHATIAMLTPLAGRCAAAGPWLRPPLMACALLAAMIAPNPAAAQTWLGTVNTDWGTSGNWSTPPTPTGGPTINTTIPNPTVIDVISVGTGTLGIAATPSSTGSLTIQRGGSLSLLGGMSIASKAGSIGTMVVTDKNTKFNAGGVSVTSIGVGDLANFGGGHGTMTVENSAAASLDVVILGVNNGDLTSASTGVVNVTSGGQLTITGQSYIGGFSGIGGTGIVTVTGSDAQGSGSLLTSGDLYLGSGAQGDGAEVQIPRRQ